MSQSEQPNLNESLSALVDGETSEWELKRVLAELDKDEGLGKDLRAQWQLHQLCSASLKKSTLRGIDLSSRISAALESETKPEQKHIFLKPFSQVAVAASVAVLALVGVQQMPLYSNLDEAQPESQMASESSASYQTVVIPEGFELPPLQAQTVSSTIPVQVNNASETVDVQSFDKAELDKHIQEAVSTHVENTSDSLNSVLPLARQISVEEQ